MGTKQTIKLARLLADFDGCEGGDFLRMLCDVVEYAEDGRGYAYSEETEAAILKAIEHEISAHKKMIYGPDPAAYGYDDPEIIREQIEQLEREE